MLCQEPVQQLQARNSASETQKSGMCTLAESLTFPSRAQFEMRSWRKVLPRSTPGFPIPFHVRSEEDLRHAIWLMRLSYLRYALKTAADPRGLFEQESGELHLRPQFKSLLEPFVPKTASHVSTEPLPA